MPRKPIKFSLDFMKKDIFSRFTVKQYDDVTFNITPLLNNEPYDITGMTGKIYVGANNEMYLQDTNITVSSNSIVVTLDKNMLNRDGRAYAEIELTDSIGTVTSTSFIFDIDRKIGEGASIPGAIDGFVAKYEKLTTEFKQKFQDSLNDVDNRFNILTSQQQQDSEVILARKGEASLKVKIDKIDEQFNTIESKKLDKNGILSMANMGQDIKEAMTGGSVAVVGKNVILNENVIDNSLLLSKLNEKTLQTIDDSFTFLYPTWEEGKYISNLGYVGESIGFKLSSIIELQENETIILQGAGYNKNVSMISSCTSTGGSIKALKICSDSLENIFTYTATKKQYVRLSCKSYTSVVKAKNYNSIVDNIVKELNINDMPVEWQEGYFIDGNGKKISHTGFKISNVIEVNFGDTIKFTATGYTTNVSMISECTSEGVFIRHIQKSFDSLEHTYSFTCDKNGTYIMFSCDKTKSDIVKKINKNTDLTILLSTIISNLENRIDKLENRNEDLKYLVENAICIGDSITEGYDGVKIIKDTYPKFLSKATNWNVKNAGKSGTTPRYYLRDILSNHDFSQYELVIICLGTNQGLTDTIEEDTSTGDFNTYADTNTGAYCRIIETIKSQNENIKIILCSIFASHTDYKNTTNEVIKKIANKYELHLIDLDLVPFNEDKAKQPIIHPNDNVHLGKVGNFNISKVVYGSLIEYIKQNIEKFNN